MSVESILAKCGMSAEDVARAVAKNQPKKTQAEIAEENERKYDGVKNIHDDFIEKTYSGDIYRDIQSGNDNGTCTTRRGTYNHIKTGDGRCSTQDDVRLRKVIDSRMKHNPENGHFIG